MPKRVLIQSRLIQTYSLNKPVSLDQIASVRQEAGLGGLELVPVAGIGRPVCNRLQRNTNHTISTNRGKELSTYPDHCRLHIERRTVPGETRESVEAEIQRIFERIAPADPTFKATSRTALVREPFEVHQDERIEQLVCNQATTLLGRESAVISSTAWMDSALLAATGIPAIVFGPGGAGAHAVVEWADLDQLERCAEILLKVIEEFCS